MTAILTPVRQAIDRVAHYRDEATKAVVNYKNRAVKCARDNQHYAAAGAVGLFLFPSIVRGAIVGVGAKLIHAGWKRLDLDTHIQPRIKPAMDNLAERLDGKFQQALEAQVGKGFISQYGTKVFSYINPVNYENAKSTLIATASAVALATITGGSTLYVMGSLYAYARLGAMLKGVTYLAQMLKPFMPTETQQNTIAA